MFSSFKKYIMSYCFFVPFSILKKAAIKNGIIVYKHNIKRERSKMDFAGKLTKRKCQVFLQHFFKKIFNIVYLLFIIYNDIIRLQLQLFLSSFLKKCIEKRLSSGSHFLYAPLSFILLIFPFH